MSVIYRGAPVCVTAASQTVHQLCRHIIHTARPKTAVTLCQTHAIIFVSLMLGRATATPSDTACVFITAICRHETTLSRRMQWQILSVCLSVTFAFCVLRLYASLHLLHHVLSILLEISSDGVTVILGVKYTGWTTFYHTSSLSLSLSLSLPAVVSNSAWVSFKASRFSSAMSILLSLCRGGRPAQWLDAPWHNMSNRHVITWRWERQVMCHSTVVAVWATVQDYLLWRKHLLFPIYSCRRTESFCNMHEH